MPMLGTVDLRALVAQLASRDKTGRTEADVQSGIKVLLVAAPLNLSEADLDDASVLLEAQAGKGRRIDVELGSTVIEVKKDLRVGNVLGDAVEQLAGYVRQREATVAHRYVGVLTDGAEWRLYHLENDELVLASTFSVSATSPDVDGLVLWLEGVLATTSLIRPLPKEIERRLGAQSSGHALDASDLAALYERHRNDTTVKLKRELWGRLLTTALGTQFEDSDELFINHTLLVLSAECIAHAVLKMDLSTLSAAAICSGDRFAQAQILNVVEADFFDWPIEVEGGDRFVRTLARRLSRFAWHEAEHDVMKVLYESVIAKEQRHNLGEYYTPDWLADRVVSAVVDAPLNQRVLDPACGSGTFLFHAVGRYLTAAADAGMSRKDALAGVCAHVAGIDVHPVAVAFARVTYLLALGDLTDRPPLSIPVYLGDSVQWNQEANLLTADALTIDTSSSPATLFAEPLRFPRGLLDDPAKFDRLVTELADRATKRTKAAKLPSLTATFKRFDIDTDDQKVLTDTFRTMCDLNDTGRDHIWGYFTRNLARPVWHARPENRVDVLVGNPPWLSYRFMPFAGAFRRMASERGMWGGSSVATHQDLSALFVARTTELYLKPGGRFGFVMPLAVLTRKQYEGFRTGQFRPPTEQTYLAFDEPWDLHAVKPSVFPVPPAVIFGTRASESVPLPTIGRPWSGRVPKHNASWSEAKHGITVGEVTTDAYVDAPLSPYSAAFSQGATVVPRMLFVVEDPPPSPLGPGPGRRAVRSWRSKNEKKPWKFLPPLEGNVETEFVFPMHLGETILPFRLQTPWNIVLPWDGETLLSADDERLDEYPGLAQWWRAADQVWLDHRKSERLTLLEQLDYMHKLTQQFPTPEHRIVYTKGGMYLAAARVDDPRVVIDHMLYWAPVSSVDEGRYLTGVFNSDSFTLNIRQHQARGEHNPRHFDKYVFRVPFPKYDPNVALHRELVEAAAAAEDVVASTTLPGTSFQAQRRHIRQTLTTSGVAQTLDSLVASLLA